jgi:hypothetical protein
MFLAPSKSVSLQTLPVDTHPAKGQFSHEEQTLKNPKSLTFRAEIRGSTISETEG